MQKKKVFAALLLIIIPVLLLPRTVFAEEANSGHAAEENIRKWNVLVGGGVDFYSKYIWRGQNLLDDPVLQPNAYVNIEDFTVSIWGNYGIENDEDWTELDYTLDYTISLGCIGPKWEMISVSVGYIYYDFPNLPPNQDSQEIYGAMALDTLLSPALAVYHDFDQGDGTYYEFSLGHSMPIDPLSLNLSAAVGYNDNQWDFDSSFSNLLVGAGLAFPLTEKITFEPQIFMSLALDSQYDDEFYAGFSLSAELWN